MARINAVAESFRGLKELKVNIHCLDNQSPVSRIAIYVKAGSRYEPAAVPGISHYLRATANLTNKNSSIFGLTRALQTHGASFNVLSDREHIIYRLDCLKDKLEPSFKLLSDAVSCPEFRSWELVDYVEDTLKVELEYLKKDQTRVLNEALNKTAFRGGLAHSMYTPEHQIKKINKHHLKQFVSDNYVPSRITVVGLGVKEEDLRYNIQTKSLLDFENTTYNGVSGESRYVGGEARLQAPFDQTMVAFVGQAPGLNDPAGVANLKLFQAILGGFGAGIKYSPGSEGSLAARVAQCNNQIKTSIVNITYSDVGLFGFTLHGPNGAIGEALKVALNHFEKAAKSITDENLATGKHVLQVKSKIESENHDCVFASMGGLAANGIKTDLINVEKVTAADVRDSVSKLARGKATLVSVGNPRYIPYLDELEK